MAVHLINLLNRTRWKPGSRALALAASLGCLAIAGCTSPPPQHPDSRLISEAWDKIDQNYVGRFSLHSKDLTYGAISGMVDALGDTGHSAFLTPGMVKDLRSTRRGELKGVGIEIQMKAGRVVVVAPIDDSPAQRAGLRPGDIITKVAGEDITDWPLNRVVEKIGGRSGTEVVLTIEKPRTGETQDVTLRRAAIRLHPVSWRALPGTNLAHLRIAGFDNSTSRELRAALDDIHRLGLEGLVLDLRNNPGGLLDEAVNVASQFLTGGNVLLVRDSHGKTVPVPVEKGGVAPDLPLVVLVNEGSASASEIVAGALQDRKRAPLIGETTFGTGTVLGEFRLQDGSALLLAVEEWLTPSSRSFWHKGLRPDIEVPLPSDATPLLPGAETGPEDLATTRDAQLLKAIETLSARIHNPTATAIASPSSRGRR